MGFVDWSRLKQSDEGWIDCARRLLAEKDALERDLNAARGEWDRLCDVAEAVALELETPSPDDPPDWQARLADRLRAAVATREALEKANG